MLRLTAKKNNSSPQNLLHDVRRAVEAKTVLRALPHDRRNKFLQALVAQVSKDREYIFAENQKDCEIFLKLRSGDKSVRPGFVLTELWMNRMLQGIERLEALPDPLGPVKSSSQLPSSENQQHEERRDLVSSTQQDISVVETAVPLGLVGVVSRFRPRITLDAVAMGIKSGNAILIDGGVTVSHTNNALIASVRRSLSDVGLPPSAVVYNEPDEKNISTAQWLKMNDFVSAAIVCGSNKLYDHVAGNTTIPIIRATGHTCNMYVAADANFDTALRVVSNAKLQRPNATNSINNLLINEKFPRLVELVEALAEQGLRILGDAALQEKGFPTMQVATEEDWVGIQNGFSNFNRLNIRLISEKGGLEEAAIFIETYGSSQSDGIVTTSTQLADAFVQRVDSACVYVNASTRFSSGECLGMGTDLAIATSRIQCRGPVSLQALTTRKFVIRAKSPAGAIRR